MSTGAQDEAVTAPAGAELLRAVFGAGPPERGPMISDLVGMELVSAEEGVVTFAAAASPALANLAGTVHGGFLATLLDSAMTCAAVTTAPPRTSCATVSLSTHFVRAVPVDAARLTVTGRTVHVGRTVVTTEGVVLDAAGRTVAHGTATVLCRAPAPNTPPRRQESP